MTKIVKYPNFVYRVVIVSGQPKVVCVGMFRSISCCYRGGSTQSGSCRYRVRVVSRFEGGELGSCFGFRVSLTGWVRVWPYWIGSLSGQPNPHDLPALV